MKEKRAPKNTAAKTEPKGERQGFRQKIDRFFGVTAAGSTLRREAAAGFTTFMAMVYILMINAGLFADLIPAGSREAGYGAAYIATAVGAVAGTMLMAFLARMPLAQASGMGISAFAASLILEEGGLSYANCLAITLIEGAVFLLLTVTGMRRKIFEAIPACIRNAIPVGIGLFIAFIGLKNAGIIVDDPSSLVKFVSLRIGGETSYFTAAGALSALLGVVAIAVMSKRNMKGAIPWSMLGTTALYYALVGLGAACGSSECLAFFRGFSLSNPFTAFANWGKYSAGAVFTEGFDFSAYLAVGGNHAGTLAMLIATSVLSMCMIAMFDTIGTMYGACSKGGLLDESGTPVRMGKMMLADSVAACLSGPVGAPAVMPFVESSSGIAAGGRTGFASFVTGLLFVVAMFLSPVARLIPSPATAAILIWVGVLMMSSVVKIDWSDPAEAVVGFLTAVVMVLGNSIAKGIGVGILAYLLVKLCTGKAKEITVPTYIIAALFLLTFLLT